jgi:V8-like Glu-specific endopeptidase
MLGQESAQGDLVKRNLIRILSVTVGILLLTVIVLGLSGKSWAASQVGRATGSTSESRGGNISNRATETLSGPSAHSWTKESMLAAQPYPLEILPNEPAVSLELAKPSVAPVIIPGSPPEVGQQTTTFSEETLALSQATVTGYNYPPPFARYQNFDSYQVYPYSTVGVLFFKQAGVRYYCSAASIGNNGIWTAGHCIHQGDGELDAGGNVIDPGTWSTEVVFVPAYQNGTTPPYGVWSVFELWITPEWFTSQDLRHDMGGVILNSNGGTLSHFVGSLGFAYNMDHSLHWMNIAYPVAPPFDGSTQQICAGSFAYADTSMPAPSPVAMGCDMTGGSSGGPWILKFGGSAGSQNLLNGHNSYRYSSHPEELYSPYFDSAAKSLWDDLTDTTN